MTIKVRPIVEEPPPPTPTALPWNAVRIARLLLTLTLAWWGRELYLHYPLANESVAHLIILPIHETGHIVFIPFGELLTAAGGTIFQILFPTIFAGYFLKNGQRFAATIPLWFVGVSAVDVVPYIKDAPFGELELIGGEHDWSFVLSELAQVHNAERIGDAVLSFGGLTMTVAIALGLWWHARPDTPR